MPTKEERIQNLQNLFTKGKLSKKLKEATKDLIVALKKGDQAQTEKISYLHQHISSGWGNDKEYEYNEDSNFNTKLIGTTAYQEFDMIWHGDF